MGPLRELNCAELVELATDWLEGALAPAERARFDEHLAGCAACRAYVEQVRATVALVGRDRTVEALPATAREGLLAAFREWRSPG
jgi:predicted anti-sigma-YlaC factor YlaD